MAEITRGQGLVLLRSALENERSSFKDHWRDLSDFVLPRRSLFTLSDTNRGDRRNLRIIDSTATLAARTMASGMMGGITSPARPWKRLTTADPNLAELGPVKEWLHTVDKRMDTIFLRSNLYNALPNLYGDLGTFATGAMLVEEDFDNILRFYTFPIGSYSLALDDKLRVRVFFREFRLTVRQVVERFGERDDQGNIKWENFSHAVMEHWKKKQFDVWIDIYHVIQPNVNYNPSKADSKLFESLYYEKGTSTAAGSAASHSHGPEKFLRERGYDYFPVLCPRWQTTGEDVYGTNCPGMTALGDIKALQIMQKRKAQAVEKMVSPPMVGPPELKFAKASILPGDITYVPDRGGNQAFRPAHEVNIRLDALDGVIREHQFRIRRAYYEDLFLMLANTDRREITAREIDERHEEKLLALGPVLEQLNQDLLDPLVDIAFLIMEHFGLLPPPPEELQGQALKVEYISIMHQAQKLAGLAGIERYASFVGEVAQIKPDAVDKFNADQAIDEYGEIIGVPPSVVVPDEEVAEIREVRAQAVEAAAQAEQLKTATGAVKDLSGADIGGGGAAPTPREAGA